MRRLVLAAALAVTATAVVVLTGCQAPQSSPMSATPAATTPLVVSPSPAATSSSAAAGEPSPTSARGSAASSAADTTLAVVIAKGKVSPNAEDVKVKEGQTVRITISSDVEESIHVHGYDQTAAASPGESGAVEFTADVKGVFEIETHESGKLVARLIVS